MVFTPRTNEGMMLAKEYLPASMILNKKYGFWFDMGWGKSKTKQFFR